MASGLELRRRVIMAGKRSLLPKEYQQVEYIQMPITAQYEAFICTNIPYSQITRIECKYEVIKYDFGNNAVYHPMFISSHSVAETQSRPPFACTDFNSGFQEVQPVMPRENGVLAVYNIIPMSSNYRLKIGGWNDNYWTAVGAYYHVNVYNGNDVIASYIPCYRKSDHKAGMYDVISKHFHPSDGEEDFIIAN